MDRARAIIYNEVTQGNTVQSLKESARSLIVETQTGFVETMRSIEVQASRIVVQEREMKTMRDEVSRILEDSQTFVSRVEAEQKAARTKFLLECDALNTKQQSIVAYVELLHPHIVEIKREMTVVTDWFKDTHAGQATQRAGEVEAQVQTFDARVQVFERDMYQLNQSLESKLGALNATVSGLQAGVGNFGGGQGAGAGPAATRDRNVFDPRDYKLADFGPKPTVVRWKKWRRDLEVFVDTTTRSARAGRVPAAFCGNSGTATSPSRQASCTTHSSTPVSATTRLRRKPFTVSSRRLTSSTG